MAEKKHEQSSFTVTDRRLFTSDGELRAEVNDDAKDEAKADARAQAREEASKTAAPKADPAGAATSASSSDKSESDKSQSAAGITDAIDRDLPTPPTSAEQEAQAAAYSQSSRDLDAQVELSGGSAKEFEMTFERFLASLYMTAMLQLGLMREQGGQPRVDIIGARQTIDTLSLIADKTKGNLTPREDNFLQNSLYEVRMAYVEVTNALARPPQAGPATGTSGR